MTFVPVSSGDQVKASVTNGNYRHMGRAGLSSFYPMDTLGNYASQDLGETGKEWANLYLTGQVKGNLDVQGGIKTDGNEVIKMDIVSTSYSGDVISLTFNHGHGANCRGVSGPFVSNGSLSSAGYVSADSTNIKSTFSFSSSFTGTAYFIVFYV